MPNALSTAAAQVVQKLKLDDGQGPVEGAFNAAKAVFLGVNGDSGNTDLEGMDNSADVVNGLRIWSVLLLALGLGGGYLLARKRK